MMPWSMQKKSTHPGKKKHKKHSSPSKKKQATEKSTKKHFSAFKSTHYDPWVYDRRLTVANDFWLKWPYENGHPKDEQLKAR